MLSNQTITGQSVLQQTLAPYVTQASLEFQLADFSQNIETGQFNIPSFSELATEKPATTDVNLNGQSITNMKELSLTGGISGLLSSALSLGLATQMFPNTGLQNLTSEVSFNDKVIKNLGSATQIFQGDSGIPSLLKRTQAVNLGFFNDYALHKDWTDQFTDYQAQSLKIQDLSSSIYKNADTLTIPDPIEQGVFNADPQALAKFRKVAVNIGVLEDNTVCLDKENRANFVAQSKQIKLGMQATDAKDFVTLDQVVHEE